VAGLCRYLPGLMFSNTGALNVAVLNVFTLRALPSLNDIDVFSVVLTPISIALHRHHHHASSAIRVHLDVRESLKFLRLIGNRDRRTPW